jgi:hypothetical protein
VESRPAVIPALRRDPPPSFLDLIHKENPAWRDLAEDFGFDRLSLK